MPERQRTAASTLWLETSLAATPDSMRNEKDWFMRAVLRRVTDASKTDISVLVVSEPATTMEQGSMLMQDSRPREGPSTT